ncbi:hypothetical protein AB0F68_21330 [Micromonospora sp. NPDC023966]|uniref:hypothetical protein n=1 Tax=Micromonospora sp. NPDC023966 TaxID=3154699 RepID=UPI0033E742EB
MIPQLVTVRYRRLDGSWLRLYVPVLPVLLLLSPLLVLAVLAGLVACHLTRISPVGALRGTGRLLWALPGTRIDIDDGPTAM